MNAPGPLIYRFGEFPKECKMCGVDFPDAAAWRKLAYVGIQPDDEEPLELRNCYCSTTLAAGFYLEEKE